MNLQFHIAAANSVIVRINTSPSKDEAAGSLRPARSKRSITQHIAFNYVCAATFFGYFCLFAAVYVTSYSNIEKKSSQARLNSLGCSLHLNPFKLLSRS
jgi:hypothetical protein